MLRSPPRSLPRSFCHECSGVTAHYLQRIYNGLKWAPRGPSALGGGGGGGFASREVLKHGNCIQSLSDVQLHDIFDRLDTNGDGVLEVEEFQQGLEMLHIQRDMPELLSELRSEGPVQLEDFVTWWQREVRSARIVTLSSSQAWSDLLHGVPPEGFGDVVLLEITFTYCRACKSFEPKFRRLAEEFSHIRFVQLVGNGSIGAMKLVQEEFKVTGSPSWFLFRRGGELLATWHGTNEDKLRQHLSPFC